MAELITKEVVPGFIQIPYKLITDRTLGSFDRMVYGAVYFLIGAYNDNRLITNAAIADLLFSPSATAVSNSLKKLEDRKYIIRRFSDPNSKKNRTGIVPLVRMEKAY